MLVDAPTDASLAVLPAGIERSNLQVALANPATRAALQAIAAESYDNAAAQLAQAFSINNLSYILRNEADEIVAFFLIGWGELPATIDRPAAPTVFLGLSCARAHRKGQGLTSRLYRAFRQDARAWETATGQRLLIWFTTATPVVCEVANRLFAEAEPRRDGSFTSEGASWARAILDGRGMSRFAEPEHPFVLRRVSTAVYAERELVRLTTFAHLQGQGLLDQLRIDARRGDRILFLARVPSEVA